MSICKHIYTYIFLITYMCIFVSKYTWMLLYLSLVLFPRFTALNIAIYIDAGIGIWFLNKYFGICIGRYAYFYMYVVPFLSIY